MIYVASSWRNPYQQEVIRALREAGYEVYDFKNPPGKTGFSWSEVGINSQGETTEGYFDGLLHWRAQEGFRSDYEAMKAADTCVLVLPCGRSAHLELGWCAGAGKKTAIVLLEQPVTPELMYLCCDAILPSIEQLLDWLAGHGEAAA